jgi:cytochrome oxidase assembly protein ShyY1
VTTQQAPRTTRGALLRDRRVWALGFLVLLVVPAFLLLSRWQLHRLDERRAENTLISDHADAAPVPVAAAMTAGSDPNSLTAEQEWRDITATGRYDPAGQQLVRRRPLNGENGYWVMTPLVLSDGSVLAVNRGWVGAGQDATTNPEVPPAPSGEVTVVGRLRLSQDAPARPADLPTGQVTDLDVRAVPASGPVFPGYLELVTSDPPETGDPALTPIPLPELDDGPHLSYAIQWVAFAVIAIGGFVFIVRGEARRLGEEGAADSSEVDSPAATE